MRRAIQVLATAAVLLVLIATPVLTGDFDDTLLTVTVGVNYHF